MDVTAPHDAKGPCAGFRVLDFSTVVSGPLCAQILGDLGADVIKIETPGGDFTRYTRRKRAGLTGFFSQFNRNKRSIVIDLKSDRGQQLTHRLAQDADVIVTNFRPGVADRLGIGYDALRAVNPGLVYVAISGFGPDGPYATLPAYDLIIQGLSGIMPIQGGEDTPQLLKSLVADKCTAMTAATSAVSGLLARERNGGAGQLIDVPMLDSFAAYVLPDLITSYTFQPLEEPIEAPIDIYQTWATADGYVVGLIIEDAQFEGLCRALDREDLIGAPEFATFLDRVEHGEMLYDMIDTELRKWPTAEMIDRARRFGAPLAPAHTIEDFFADPQAQHNRAWFEADDPIGGRMRYMRYPARFSHSPASLRHHPPRLGQHTDDILTAAGFDAAAIAALRAEGCVS